MNRCSALLIIREKEIKTTMRYHLTLAIIKKSGNKKRWRGCGKKGTLLPCWWECKPIQLLWRTVQRFHEKLGIKRLIQLFHYWAYTLRKPKLKKTQYPNVHCSKIYNSQDMEAPCPSTDEWIKKLWYTYTMDYYWAIKRNAFNSVLVRWDKPRTYYAE